MTLFIIIAHNIPAYPMTAEKEIDIYTLLRFLSTFIRKFRNIIIGIFVVLIVLACVKHFNSSPKYTSKMSVVSNSLTYSMVSSVQYPLERAINKNNDKLVSEWLGIPLQKVAQLYQIELSEVNATAKAENFTSSFSFELTAADASIFKDFQSAIINYLNNNEFVKERTAIKRENLESFLENIKGQIGRLDSIQQIIPSAMQNNGVKTALNDYNLGSIYQQMINLKSKETEIMEQLENVEEFQLISGFDLIENKKSLQQTLVIAILIGIAITLLFAGVYTLRVMIKRSLQDS